MPDHRVALIGLGEAGFGLHLPALAGLAGASIVGAVDTDAGRRARAAARYGIPVYDDFDAMLAAGSADVVIVATPPDSHAEYVVRSLSAGAHVICEKPFVSSVAEADRVIAAAAAAGRQIAVNHEFPEMPIFRTLIEHVQHPASGDLRFAQVWQLIHLPPGVESGWRGQTAHRTLFEAGVHLVDLLMVMFREKPMSVQASTSGAAGAVQADAVVLATLEFSRGRLAHLLQNRICSGERQYFEVRADTEHASFRASFGGRARLSTGLFRSRTPHVRWEYGSSGIAWREDGVRRRQLARNPANPNVVGTREVLRDALAAFARNVAPRCGAHRARDVIETVAACYLSAMTGQRVKLDGSELSRVRNLHMGAAASPVNA